MHTPPRKALCSLEMKGSDTPAILAALAQRALALHDNLARHRL
jgi:hypothetical protein